MKMSTKNIIVAVLAVALLLIVAVSYFGGGDDPDKEEDLEGKWYLVGRNSLDQNGKFSTALDRTYDSKYDIDVKGFDEYSGVLFYATSQGIDFCGANVKGTIVFEYRYNDKDWNNDENIADVVVTGYGKIDRKGYLITYETHYNNENDWFVAVSTYSKSDGLVSMDLGPNVKVPIYWTMDNGEILWCDVDTGPDDKILSGRALTIAYQKGPFVRVEMQQEIAGGISTIRMNGVFISQNNGQYLASLLDDNGHMWSLYIKNDIAILRTVAESDVDSNNIMVVAEREYYSGIRPDTPGTVDMTGDVWTTDSTVRLIGDTGIGSKESYTVTIAYEEQKNEGIFAGINTKEAVDKRSEVGYFMIDPNLSAGTYMLRMGTQEATSIEEGYGFLTTDADGKQTLIVVKFNYDDTGNSAVYRKYTR